MIENLSMLNESIIISNCLTDACRRQANIVVGKDISPNPKGVNIFMGIGCITKNRLSSGLGIGFLSMACLARECQKQMQKNGLDSKIFVLIADGHAINEKRDSAEPIMNLGQRLDETINKVFLNLEVDPDNLFIIRSTNPKWIKSISSYVDWETADILFANKNLGCGVKIGWQSKRESLNGSLSRDEKWFDDIARLTHPDLLNEMSFIRGPEWISLSTNSGGHNLPLPPYIGEENFHLGSSINLNQLWKSFSSQMRKDLGTINSAVRKVLGIQTNSVGLSNLQSIIDKCAIIGD